MSKSQATKIRGNFFIVPNAIGTYNSAYEINITLMNKANDDAKALGLEGVEVQADQPTVQIWATGGDSENWQDHGAPKELLDSVGWKSTKGNRMPPRFPSFLPLEKLEGIKEGDEVDLGSVVLVAKQLNYRYKRFGKFEEVYKALKQRHYNSKGMDL